MVSPTVGIERRNAATASCRSCRRRWLFGRGSEPTAASCANGGAPSSTKAFLFVTLACAVTCAACSMPQCCLTLRYECSQSVGLLLDRCENVNGILLVGSGRACFLISAAQCPQGYLNAASVHGAPTGYKTHAPAWMSLRIMAPFTNAFVDLPQKVVFASPHSSQTYPANTTKGLTRQQYSSVPQPLSAVTAHGL